MKVLYIAGYGRSGSTLLSMILNAHPQMIGTGELTNLFWTAAYGKLEGDWKEIADKVCKETGLSAAELENINVKNDSLFKLFASNKNKAIHLKAWRIVFEELERLYPDKTIVDASKTAYRSTFRPKHIMEFAPEQQILHLVRRPEGVMFSMKKGANKSNDSDLGKAKKGGAFRGLTGWLISNIVTSLMYKKYQPQGQYLPVVYEDLALNPKVELEKIANFANVDPVPFAQPDQLLISADCSFSGNRLRLSEKILIKPDVAWKDNITGTKAFLAKVAMAIYKLF